MTVRTISFVSLANFAPMVVCTSVKRIQITEGEAVCLEMTDCSVE